jgi:hypothetical protein
MLKRGGDTIPTLITSDSETKPGGCVRGPLYTRTHLYFKKLGIALSVNNAE